MLLAEVISSARLYHGTSVFNALSILEKDTIEPRSEHRREEHGTTRKVMGVSLTRSYEFAKKWGTVVMEFNRASLAYHHRIMTWDFWGKSRETSHGLRRQKNYAEAEEFVPGPIKNVSRSLTAIYWGSKSDPNFDERVIKAYGHDMNQILNHPLYKGIK
jgi:hypothetical protein